MSVYVLQKGARHFAFRPTHYGTVKITIYRELYPIKDWRSSSERARRLWIQLTKFEGFRRQRHLEKEFEKHG